MAVEMESESMWKSFIPYQGKQGPLVSVKKKMGKAAV